MIYRLRTDEVLFMKCLWRAEEGKAFTLEELVVYRNRALHREEQGGEEILQRLLEKGYVKTAFGPDGVVRYMPQLSEYQYRANQALSAYAASEIRRIGEISFLK